MGRMKSTKRRFVRRAGFQVPRHVTRMLAQLHPTVDILWDVRGKRWAIVQTIGGISMMVRHLGERETPTLDNTVYYLNSIHPSRFQSRFQQERFLEGLDRSEAADDAARRAKDAIRVGSSDLFDQLHGRRVVSLRR